MAQAGKEKRKHRRSTKPAPRWLATYRVEIERWMRLYRMTYKQAQRDPAFKYYRSELRYFERWVARNKKRGLDPYANIDISPEGYYAEALTKLGYRNESNEFWYPGGWGAVGSGPQSEAADIAELLR